MHVVPFFTPLKKGGRRQGGRYRFVGQGATLAQALVKQQTTYLPRATAALSTKFGYGLPACLARRFAASFCAAESFLGLSPFGAVFSQKGLSFMLSLSIHGWWGWQRLHQSQVHAPAKNFDGLFVPVKNDLKIHV